MAANDDYYLSLPPKQQIAVDLVVLGRTLAEIASAVGVGIRTVWRWRRYNSKFQAAVAQRRREILEAASDKLRSVLSQAIDVLQEELANPENKNRARIAIELVKACSQQAFSYSSADQPGASLRDITEEIVYETNGVLMKLPYPVLEMFESCKVWDVKTEEGDEDAVMLAPNARCYIRTLLNAVKVLSERLVAEMEAKKAIPKNDGEETTEYTASIDEIEMV
jgi:hypothetical protein